MKISSFDLNLFVILNAIYTEGSLTKAAEVVGITQPAVSNALSRLREKFNDDLFVRTGSGMVPTQKTENMIQDVQSALTLIQQSVNEPDTFDANSTKRNFKLSLGDVSEGRVLPFIMREIYQEAPNISVGSYAYPRSDQVHALSTNNLDFVVDPIIPRSDEINSEKFLRMILLLCTEKVMIYLKLRVPLLMTFLIKSTCMFLEEKEACI